ncbi:hypothetical protein QYE76_007283 [Lolium multiflorum]|uniref:Uncharacterized protein n=1 Tax=Lolium multiflorum TaxID=4521 RepID=A0AAD8RWE9_LOLMU|nr:hypothetical protein QYE76_007283 [Lolium multiflorum]
MSLESTPPAAGASSQPLPPSPVASGAPATPADIMNLVASMRVLKRQHAGTHVVLQAGVAATNVVPSVPRRAKGGAAAKLTMVPKTSHAKSKSLPLKRMKSKTTTSRGSPIIGKNGNASFMEMLDVVDIVVPALVLFDDGVDGDGEEDDGEDDEGEEGDEDEGEEGGASATYGGGGDEGGDGPISV